MRSIKRVTLLVAALALALGAFTLPASAAPPADVIVFQGEATTTPLWAPFLGPSGGLIEADGTWEFNTFDPSSVCITVLQGPCVINSSGLLTHALHGRSHPLPPGTIPHIDLLGPSCGASQGFDGAGDLSVASTSYDLSNVGWITSAGGSLPVTGDISEPSTGDSGILVVYVQAQGGADCFSENGTTSFAVLGVGGAVTLP